MTSSLIMGIDFFFFLNKSYIPGIHSFQIFNMIFFFCLCSFLLLKKNQKTKNKEMLLDHCKEYRVVSSTHQNNQDEVVCCLPAQSSNFLYIDTVARRNMNSTRCPILTILCYTDQDSKLNCEGSRALLYQHIK